MIQNWDQWRASMKMEKKLSCQIYGH